MTPDDVRIRDVSSRPGKEWIPPIGAMGAPLSHLLYRDLVQHAGLRLFRDREGMPWLEIQDGGSRRTFPVPSVDLRTALDRFRMRRNVRPVSENDLNDFVRICEARASDPDIEIPLIERTVESKEASPPPPQPIELRDEGGANPPPTAGPPEPEPEPSRAAPASIPSVRKLLDTSLRATQNAAEQSSSPPPRRGPDPAVSAGYPAFRGQLGGPQRYVRTLRELTQNGGWLGTSEELARRTGDHPEAVVGWLERYRSALLQHNLVVTAVELEDGWRWLAFDRGRRHKASARAKHASSSKKGSDEGREKRQPD